MKKKSNKMAKVEFQISNFSTGIILLSFKIIGNPNQEKTKEINIDSKDNISNTTEPIILSPADLKAVLPPDPISFGFTGKGLVISGQGPIWLYGFLIHFYHPVKFVATHDNQQEYAVIVESHTPDYCVGDVLEIPQVRLIK